MLYYCYKKIHIIINGKCGTLYTVFAFAPAFIVVFIFALVAILRLCDILLPVPSDMRNHL